MKFDDILTHLGQFGYYQRRLYLLLCIPAISTGCYMMMLVFIMAPPQHRCKIPGYQNDTYEVHGSYHQDLINSYIPLSNDDVHFYRQCQLYNTTSVTVDNSSLVGCNEWVYEQTTFYKTFTSQENLVCDDALKTSHAQMVFYFGVLVGDLGFGMLSDHFGRKKTFMITAVLLLVSGLGASWAPEFYSFAVLEFIIGAAIHGAFMICCVLGVELVGPKKRVYAGVPIHMFFTIGLFYLTACAYFFRDWFTVQIAVSAPCVMYLAYWWLIPESPRWLISKERYTEAERILHTAAKANKVVLPEKIVDSKTIKSAKEGRLWHLFTSRILFFRTIVIFWNWAVISMVYYGVTMHTGNLGGNWYFNFFILALVEIPAVLSCIFLLDRMGRKKLHCLCMFVAGFSCLGTIFPVLFGGDELQPLTLTLAVMGKFGSAAAFSVVYIFSLELYPTIVRNGGMGASSCVARFGGMAAPYIAKLGDLVSGKFGQALPLVVFGACSVSAGLLALMLPETLNKKLPDSIKDAEKFGVLKDTKVEDIIYIDDPEKDKELEKKDTTEIGNGIKY